MTNEEAKANLEKLLLLYDDGMIDFHVIRESVKIAIETLQNSPAQMPGTSDLISRQDALDILTEWKRTFKETSHNQSAADIELIKSEFAKLIPVKNPERKPGKWEIYVISAFDGEGCRCSECGFEGAPYWDFCPCCGADMRGEQNDT